MGSREAMLCRTGFWKLRAPHSSVATPCYQRISYRHSCCVDLPQVRLPAEDAGIRAVFWSETSAVKCLPQGAGTQRTHTVKEFWQKGAQSFRQWFSHSEDPCFSSKWIGCAPQLALAHFGSVACWAFQNRSLAGVLYLLKPRLTTHFCMQQLVCRCLFFPLQAYAEVFNTFENSIAMLNAVFSVPRPA